MIILDENILEGQRLLLDASRIAARQIGVDIGNKGLKDEEIIVLLRRQRNPTFSPATRISMCPTSGIEATAWWWRVLVRMKWPRSFVAFSATPISILKRNGWAG